LKRKWKWTLETIPEEHDCSPVQNVEPTTWPEFLRRNYGNMMECEPVLRDPERATTIFLAHFVWLTIFLFNGDIFFNLMMRGKMFMFSFFEWNMLVLNRCNILSALKAGKCWSFSSAIENPFTKRIGLAITFNTFRKLYLDKNGDLTVFVQLHKAFSVFGQMVCEETSFVLDRLHLEQLLATTQTPFHRYVNSLQESRLTYNIAVTAICNLLTHTHSPACRKPHHARLAVSNDMVLGLSELFGFFSYHSTLRLRYEMNRIYNSVPITAKRTLPFQVNISDSIHMLFPGQLQFLLTLYSKAKQPGGAQFFECPYCITPICKTTNKEICRSFIY
jgi:hypothetical protein